MFTYSKSFELSKVIEFTDNEMKEVIEYYKKDCEKWHLDPNDPSNFEDYMDSEYLWNWNDYDVDYSESNSYDLFNDIQEFL